MANVLHKNLTSTDLHEPKGIAAASANQVYVANGAGSGAWASLRPIGVVEMYVGSTAPTGWLFANGNTIGGASSGGTARANADTATLYTLLWESSTNTTLPIQDSTGVATTRGISAAVDFAANKRLPLPDLCGRAVVGKDNMGGVSSKNRLTGQTGGVDADTLFNTGGVETHVLTSAQNASHSHTQQGTITSSAGSAHSHTVGTLAVAAHTHGAGSLTGTVEAAREGNDIAAGGSGRKAASDDDRTVSISGSTGSASPSLTGATANESSHTHSVILTGATATSGSGTAHNNVQPSIVLNMIIFYGA